MSSGRLAAHDDRSGVDAKPLAIGPHPANHRLHVLNWRRPWRFIHHAILAGDAHITMLGQAQTVALFEGRAVSRLPTTPRQKEQARDRTGGVGWSEDIDFELAPTNVMNDNVLLYMNVGHRCLPEARKIVVRSQDSFLDCSDGVPGAKSVNSPSITQMQHPWRYSLKRER